GGDADRHRVRVPDRWACHYRAGLQPERHRTLAGAGGAEPGQRACAGLGHAGRGHIRVYKSRGRPALRLARSAHSLFVTQMTAITPTPPGTAIPDADALWRPLTP